MDEVRFLNAGDTAVTVEFGNEISEAINGRIRSFNIALQDSGIAGIVETVPTYRSLMVHYDPGVIRYASLEKKLKGLLSGLDKVRIPPSEVLEIPVLYGGEEGPDLPFVAEHSGRSADEVVAIHSAPEYLIYMLGFTPGFTYLGGMRQMGIVTIGAMDIMQILQANRARGPCGSRALFARSQDYK